MTARATYRRFRELPRRLKFGDPWHIEMKRTGCLYADCAELIAELPRYWSDMAFRTAGYVCARCEGLGYDQQGMTCGTCAGKFRESLRDLTLNELTMLEAALLDARDLWLEAPW